MKLLMRQHRFYKRVCDLKNQAAILLDFGASRIKAALWNPIIGIVDFIDAPSPSSKPISNNGNHEMPAEDYWSALEATAGLLIAKHGNYNFFGIFICSEMHGIIACNKNYKPLTGYISWKDERARNVVDALGFTTYQRFEMEAGNFQNLTGMRLRAGLPILTLSCDCKKLLNKSKNLRFLTLVDWILVRGGCKDFKVNPTMAAATGFYDIHKREWSNKLKNIAGFVGDEVIFNELSENLLEPIGRINLAGVTLSVFGGIGDFQAVMYGSKFSIDFDGLVNLGTGSQVAINYRGNNKSTFLSDIRIDVLNEMVEVITHIPSGRALSGFAYLVDDIAGSSGGVDIFWRQWSSLDCCDVINPKIKADLNIFEASWKKSSESGWVSVGEATSLNELVAGIANSWAHQYVQALNEIDINCNAINIAICGGLSRKSKFMAKVLNEIDPRRKYIEVTTVTGEETLDGLMYLACQIINRIKFNDISKR